jgi:hypothetical protein
MSTQDYKLLADAIRPWRPSEPNEQALYLAIVESIAEVLKQDNKRFSKELFLKDLNV